MKIWSIIVFMFPAFVMAQNADTLFEIANKKYSEGKYDSAITFYTRIMNEGYEAADLYFNAGNAYYKTGEFANAILNYERALKIKPGNEDYKHNLALANENTVDKLEAPTLVFYEKAWQDYMSKNNANNRGILAIALLWIALILFALFLFMNSPRIKKFTFFSSLGVLAIAFYFLLISFLQHQNEKSQKHAIIFSESEYVKSAPGADSKNLFMLHSGTKVKVIGNLNTWKQIKLPNGNSGWLPNQSLEII